MGGRLVTKRIGNTVPWMETIAFLLGVLAAVFANTRSGWWLNSGEGIISTVLALFGLAVLLGWSMTALAWNRAGALWLGAMTGLTATLFRIGPGTLWPIVLVVSALITACVVLTGTGVAQLRKRQPR